MKTPFSICYRAANLKEKVKLNVPVSAMLLCGKEEVQLLNIHFILLQFSNIKILIKA